MSMHCSSSFWLFSAAPVQMLENGRMSESRASSGIFHERRSKCPEAPFRALRGVLYSFLLLSVGIPATFPLIRFGELDAYGNDHGVDGAIVTCNGLVDHQYKTRGNSRWDTFGDLYAGRMHIAVWSHLAVSVLTCVGWRYQKAVSTFARKVQAWLLLNWLVALLWSLDRGCQWCGGGSYSALQTLCGITWNARQIALASSIIFLSWMVRDRVLAIEDCLGCHRWKSILACLLRADLLVLLVFISCSVYRLLRDPENEHLGTTASILMLLLTAVSVQILAVAIWVHVHPLRLAFATVRESSGRRREDARSTARIVVAHLTATTLCAFTTLLSTSCDFYSHLIWAYHPGAADPMYELFKTGTFGLDLIMNAVALLFLSNLLQLPKHKKVKPRKLRTAQIQSAEWDRKVAELSNRGLPLEAILRFYSHLGHECMTNYRAEHHTTADVVWQAVIPETAASSVALSTKLMFGRTRTAQRMVTHSWSNKFVNLVAAIIADGLGQHMYQDIAQRLLSGDLEKLTEELREKGALEVTYWVCAFCINQHTGICCNTARCDTVTGEVPPPCPCGCPKVWNDTPPLGEDNESIECELNKFDDVMHYLMTRVPDFSQVAIVPNLVKCGCPHLVFCWNICVPEIGYPVWEPTF